MASIINIEKSQYLNSNIEIYTSNKVGQYSKFLDKNPLFVTYFHINSAQSRTDVGTGGVNSDLGKYSPIRYNQINNLPVYNIPELKPSTNYDEYGYDIELDISDATLLPNTIKPTPGDYMLIVLPNTIEFLFRVNEFSYNTIQSNDFYLFSADLKATGTDLIKKIESQVVQVYETIFENIGTEDKCFILSENISLIQSTGNIFIELCDAYYNNFFDDTTGTFVCKNNDVTPMNEYWFYDKYVEKFIMDSMIYFVDNSEKSVMLSCADLITPDMNLLFMQTLHYAVLNNTLDYLAPYQYYYQVDIQKPLSPFIIYHLKCKGTNLVLTRNELKPNRSDGLDSGLLMNYFHRELIYALKGIDIDSEDEDIPDDENTDSEITPPSIEEDNDEDVDDGISQQNEEDDDNEFASDFYLDQIIYQYLTNKPLTIEKSKLIPYMLRVDCYTYMTMPLVIYIVKKYYDSYFSKTEL